MEAQALRNVRERRKRLQQSSIFDGSEKVRKPNEEEESVARDLNDQIDLTVMQN